MMDCDAACERLPWLLNGRLEGHEAEEVRRHVGACARCRAEMEDTRRAAAVFGAHLPTAAIIDTAWDRTTEGLDPDLAARHLEGCAECREELALARESRQLARMDAEPSPGRRRAVWPVVELPATLAAGLVLGALWDAGRGTAIPSPAPPGEDRVSILESEVSRLRGLVAGLEAAARKDRLPRLNLPLFEVLPASLVRGGEAADGNEIVVPAGAVEVALLLSADAPQGTRATLAIRKRDGGEIWRGEGLVSGPPGGYVVVVPVDLLPAGRYVLTLRPERGATATYGVLVRHAG